MSFGRRHGRDLLSTLPFESPRWRFIVTDLNSATLTFLDRLASDRTATFVLNQPAIATGRVPADSPEINIIHTDGFPFLAEGVRLLYGLRNESTSGWVCRFAGRIEQIEDASRSNDGQSHYTAYDPWRYLMNLPATDEGTIDLIGPSGRLFTNTPGSTILTTLLTDSLPGGLSDAFLVADEIETTVALDYTVQQGKMLGEVMADLVNTGTMDIILKPIYNPTGFPGICCTLNIYNKAGVDNPGAIFAWDMPSRSLVGISDLFDGTQRANEVQFYSGMGGGSVTPTIDATSIARYGRYNLQQFFPGLFDTNAIDAVEKLAQEEVNLRKDGQQTVTINPAPERSPSPFLDYNLGDRVPIYASARLRQAIGGVSRIYGIPLEISDDALEQVRQMILASDSLAPVPDAAISTKALGATSTPAVRIAMQGVQSHLGKP